MSRRVNDVGLAPTPENLGQARKYLFDHNHLVRKSRKRGESLPTEYISQTPTFARDRGDELAAAKELSLDQLKEIDVRGIYLITLYHATKCPFHVSVLPREAVAF